MDNKNCRENILRLITEYGDSITQPEPFVPGLTAVPVSQKILSGVELSMMTSAVLDGWLTAGRFNDKFEKQLAEFIGVKHAITTNSGSSANLLALSALTSPTLGHKQIKPGDEVITVAAGFPTTVNPIIQNGLIPVFLDVDIPTYNVSTTDLEMAISRNTKAVMIAHTLGNPYNLAAVKAFTKKHGLWLIEDCCDALGSEYDGNKVGTFGDIGTLSFYPAHQITMGEGGAVFTNSGKLLPIIKSFRDWGRDCFCDPGKDNTCGKRFGWKLGDLPEGYDHKYIYSHLGYNLKITDIQAACGLAQLKRLKEFVATRRKNFSYLTNRLQHLTDYLILPEATPRSNPSWFGYPITLKEDVAINRKELVLFLTDHNIHTRQLFAGNITKQPYFKDRVYRIVGDLNSTELIMNRTFWVGVHPGLTVQMLDYVASTLENFIQVYCSSKL